MQISKFYPQILIIEGIFYVRDRPLTEINVMDSFCALSWICKQDFDICCFKAAVSHRRETEAYYWFLWFKMATVCYI